MSDRHEVDNKPLPSSSAASRNNGSGRSLPASPAAEVKATTSTDSAAHRPADLRHDKDAIRRIFETGEYPYKKKVARARAGSSLLGRYRPGARS